VLGKDHIYRTDGNAQHEITPNKKSALDNVAPKLF
jgi:hypothetical protein